jgi:xylulokinase
MPAAATTLGIDLGTSELKLALLAEDGRLVATAGAPLTVARPQPHWAEQEPRDWWNALVTAARTVRAAQPDAWSSVQAVGLSGQMHGAVLLDAAHEVLRPAILWNYTRSAAECE